MKRPKYWWALIVFLVAWSFYEVYPPTNGNLITEFNDQANPATINATFTQIVQKAKALEKADPDPHHQFSQLLEAVGTNDIQPYFPYFDVRNEERPTYTILNLLQRKAAGKIKLGLDLQGGTEFLVSLDTNHIQAADTNAPSAATAVERQRMVGQAAEVLRRRVDGLGVAEPIIQPVGENQIMIQLPGLSQANQDEARQNIQKAAFLEFKLVNPDSQQLIHDGVTPPGYEVMTLKEKRPDGTAVIEKLLVQKKAANGLTGKYIKRAFPSRNPLDNEPVIEFEFDSVGAEKFSDFTENHIGDRLAIVLDGELRSAPSIKGRIGASGQIDGIPDMEEAITIANVLENPLETPVKFDGMTEVDPTLGKDSIASGIKAALYATFFVALFMAVYYHRCGMIADLAMVLNLIILLGVMCSISATLTLPGIAGIVLTIGMAVDANVLIYERLREEMTAGKSMRGALSAAYSRAFRVIFDSHTTTLISAIVLIYFGTGPVKGFGVTLTIGVALSLFTSLVMTRLIFDFLLGRNWLNRVTMFRWIGNPGWDFMKWAKFAFITSWTIILVGMSYGIFVRGSKCMGIDFLGGDAVKFSYQEKIGVDKVRAALDKVGEVQIQYQAGDNMNILQVVTPHGKGTEAISTLTAAFPNAGFQKIGLDSVGATVGVQVRESAVVASFLSLIFILFYVALRYEFSFSVGAVLAVIHDVLMTIGIFCLTPLQFSAPIVAAILTIIGFSINDTIVIFDRIREDLKLGVHGSFKDVMNIAINQTLSRTIITSGTVFIATVSLFIFGGGVIHDFAFTFLVGIITGTYSSIYIASALVLWWHKGERPKSASQVAVEQSSGAKATA